MNPHMGKWQYDAGKYKAPSEFKQAFFVAVAHSTSG